MFFWVDYLEGARLKRKSCTVVQQLGLKSHLLSTTSQEVAFRQTSGHEGLEFVTEILGLGYGGEV